MSDFGEDLKNRRNNKTLPLVIVILIVTALIPITYYAVNYYVNEIRTSATATEKPVGVEISNISDNSATVSWVTPSQETICFLKYGESDTLDKTAYDERDEAGETGEYKVHYVVLKGLSADTTYYYSIFVGGKEYMLPNDKPFELKTGTLLNDVGTPEPIIGEVEGEKEEAVIVFLYLKNESGFSSTLSTLVEKEGYTFDLSNLRTSDLTAPFNNYEGSTVFLRVLDGNMNEGTIETEILDI